MKSLCVVWNLYVIFVVVICFLAVGYNKHVCIRFHLKQNNRFSTSNLFKN